VAAFAEHARLPTMRDILAVERGQCPPLNNFHLSLTSAVAFARYRTALSAFELSLKQQNSDIENSRPETRAKNLLANTRKAKFSAAETN
jgi:hypothetical protein